jgi:hypothetical protein
MSAILKTKRETLGEQTLTLYEASALDYLDYLDYVAEHPFPVLMDEDRSDMTKVARWMREMNRVDLLHMSRFCAVCLYRGFALSIDDTQHIIQKDWRLEVTQALYLKAIQHNGLASAATETSEEPVESVTDEEPITPKT